MIRVYSPIFTEDDAQAAASTVRSGILSAFGPEVSKLESNFSNYVNTKYALACSSGTAGLYMALSAVIEPGGTVAVPTCSYAATAFSAIHHNADIVFIDADLSSWNIDLDHLERVLRRKRIDAVIAVHNYGNPIDMDRLMQLSKTHGFYVIEDACEAISAKWNGNYIGGLGHIGVFSFYGNKYISAGEGGMVVTNDEVAHKHMELVRGQGQDPSRRFWHIIPGWNFRLTNVQAAIINSQFSRLDSIVKRKREIYKFYRDNLHKNLIWQETPEGGESCWWMISVRHERPGWYKIASDHLARYDIETRPIFPPIHTMPACSDYIYNDNMPNAAALADTGISIPSGPGLTDKELRLVCEKLNEIA